MDIKLFSRLIAFEGANARTLNVVEAEEDSKDKEIMTLVVSNIPELLEV